MHTLATASASACCTTARPLVPSRVPIGARTIHKGDHMCSSVGIKETISIVTSCFSLLFQPTNHERLPLCQAMQVYFNIEKTHQSTFY